MSSFTYKPKFTRKTVLEKKKKYPFCSRNVFSYCTPRITTVAEERIIIPTHVGQI